MNSVTVDLSSRERDGVVVIFNKFLTYIEMRGWPTEKVFLSSKWSEGWYSVRSRKEMLIKLMSLSWLLNSGQTTMCKVNE